MAGSLLGTRVVRLEDPTLLTGEGQYVGDIFLPGGLHARFVRSVMPHANISVDVSQARGMAGVVDVFDCEGLSGAKVAQRFIPDPTLQRFPLAKDKVRYVGEPVALVVAESSSAAHDAAEAVVVNYEPLPLSLDAEAMFCQEKGENLKEMGFEVVAAPATSDTPVESDTPAASGSPAAAPDQEPGQESVALLYPERGSDVIAQDFPLLEPSYTTQDGEAAFSVSLRMENNRMAVAPMEPQAISAEPHEDGRLTVRISSQGPHTIQGGLAESLDIPPENLRVISPWVGGGFGGKGGWVPEHVAVAQAARLLNRPVMWLEDRTENILSMQSRHQIQHGNLTMTQDGRFLSLRTHAIADAGGYLEVGGMVVIATRMMAQGVYKFADVRSDVGAVCTNKAPTTAFRGAGRPQATCLIERLVDMAATESGIDPAELRLRNFLAPEEFPVQTPTMGKYDTGEYAKVLRQAMEASGYEELRKEQQERRLRSDSKLLGIGVCCYVEITAGFGGKDFASVEITEEGKAIVKAGTSSHGQGHETVFAMIASDALGVDMEDVIFIQSDTAEVPRGEGTGGSRSGQVGGSAVLGACDQVLVDAKRLAAHLLEASEEDIVVAEGGLAVAGVPATKLSWAALAQAAADSSAPASPVSASANLPVSLFAEHDFSQEDATYPFGAHICVVEVDSETGKVEVLRHVAVDDCGVVMNPVIVEGQQHGGIASGISQALWEHVEYDQDGNPRNTNFADYLLPSAAEFPFFEAHSSETPTDLNPLGAKGIGEAGTIGAIPATHNAVIDALGHLGVRHLDMPLTPEKIWRAVQESH